MKRMTNMKKYTSRKKTSTAITAVAIAIASSVVMTSVWQIPQATASSLEEIKASREVSAPIDQVWNVVSDLDNETKYWSTFKAIKNINKTAINMTANTTEREVTLAAGPLRDNNSSICNCEFRTICGTNKYHRRTCDRYQITHIEPFI
jgi:hypothetical protein